MRVSGILVENGGGVSSGHSKPQASLEVDEGEAVEAQDFLAREIAAQDGDGAAWETELVREEFTQRGSGAALDGWSVDFDFQGVAEPTDHLAARGVGNGFDGEGAEIFHEEFEPEGREDREDIFLFLPVLSALPVQFNPAPRPVRR